MCGNYFDSRIGVLVKPVESTCIWRDTEFSRVDRYTGLVGRLREGLFVGCMCTTDTRLKKRVIVTPIEYPGRGKGGGQESSKIVRRNIVQVRVAKDHLGFSAFT